MTQYRVTGMTCAACSARVEQTVSALPGVERCTVSLLTNSMTVEGSVAPDAVAAALGRVGFGATPMQEAAQPKKKAENLEESATRPLLRRLLVSIGFLAVLMYLSMGHTMFGWPLPGILADNPLAVGLAQLLLTVIVMVINRQFFVSGVKSLLHGAPTMDTLVSLGSSAAFVYSTYVLFTMTAGDTAAMNGLHDLYFESGAMILSLITFGKMLEARSKGRTTDALRGLMALSPRTATLLVDGEERVVPAEQVKVGDLFLVRPGDTVPVDGVVLEGESAVDESALTGESVPVDKVVGDTVSAATISHSGYLRCRATRVGQETTLSQIIRMVEDAAATKAPIAKIADKVAGVFVPVVLGIALITVTVWLLCGQTVGYAIARGISVLVISCPCALALATPMAIMVGSGMGARHGVLFKTAAAMEQTGRTKIVALDKTGTITAGEPQVTDVISVAEEGDLLGVACALEQNSEHPLGAAVRRYGEQMGTMVASVTDFRVLPGNGLIATVNGATAVGGNEELIRQYAEIAPEIENKAAALAQAGKTPLFFAAEGRLLGVIAVADRIKEESPAAIAQLKEMGLRVVMLTGDNQRTAAAIGQQVGVDEVIAQVLPGEKETHIRRLMEQGATTMVGDGINDAPALTRAHTGIAIGAGTDIAIDAADVVLMNSRLTDVPAAIRLSRAVLRNIRLNLFWAFFYNALGIPLAAGVFIPLFGIGLSPMFGAAAMCLSSFCVMTNTLRLNWFRMYPEQHHHQQAHTCACHSCKEEEIVKKEIKVEGMMCPHCEAHVKKALEEIPGVTEAVADRQTGIATVTLSEDVAEPVLRAAIEAQGYKTLD
ncbi:MAG: heavy metal translocating P-type ATPase [Clostridia bacterium]|nr:heavy metal translocating P-type ATPase [Clostridia bacterium]